MKVNKLFNANLKLFFDLNLKKNYGMHEQHDSESQKFLS